jgi:hypothetical protein
MFASTGPEYPDRDRAAVQTLEGERALPARWTVQWDCFLDLGTSHTQWSRLIDTTIALPLRQLPLRDVTVRERSLPYRTLVHGYDAGLPSGQALARELRLPVVAEGSDPLWLYTLREAAIAQGGVRLGPLGATLVGEVIIKLLRRDPNSFVTRDPDWIPTLPARGSQSTFDLADFLRHARVPIDAAQWISRPL